MTELEKIRYTKGFIDKMAAGINPLDDSPIPENDLLNQVRISRCLFYVSDILRQVIESGVEGPIKKKGGRKRPFSLTEEQLQGYTCSASPLTASELCKRLSDLNDDPQVKRLTYNALTGWLLQRGILAENKDPDQKLRKYPTALGCELGLTVENRQSLRGDYDVVLYTQSAQQFILDNLGSLTAYIAEKKETDAAVANAES